MSPGKNFNGHVIDLKDKVDYVFVPKMMSVYEKEYICPKFCDFLKWYRTRQGPSAVDRC